MEQSSSGQNSGDFEYDTDQSTRVARRLAHGVYRLTHGGREIGEEVWGIFALLNGAYRLMTDIDLTWPIKNAQRAQLDLDARWNTHGVWAQVDINNIRRMASYIPEGNTLSVEIMETRLHEHEEEQRNYRARLRNSGGVLSLEPARLNSGATSGRTVLQQELPFDAATFLDFGSTMFNFVILQRLQLTLGSSATFNTVVLTLPSLEPLSIRQTYRYESDETLGNDPARRYTITETGSPGTTTFWTDARGIVIKQELPLDGVAHICEMLNYRWQA
jgi:hypothetical protein